MSRPRNAMFGTSRAAKSSTLARWLKIAGIVAGVALVIAAVVGGFLLRYASSQLVRQEIPALEQGGVAGGATDAADEAHLSSLDVLIVGLDSREGLTPEQLAELGTEDVGSSLTDTVMLVQVHPGREKAVVVSFPRDLKVDVPGHGDRKINAVHGLGGPNLLVQVVEDYTGIQIDHYAEVDLAGFLRLVDSLGGTEVCLEQPMVDAYAGVNLPAGCQVLNAAQAVGFVRSRRVADEFGTADDFGRIARQQYFLKQVARQVTAAGTLLNPFRLKSLIDAVTDAVLVDDALGPRQMLDIAGSLKDLDPENVDFRVIPGYWSPQTGYVHAYPEETAALLQALREGEELPGGLGVEAAADLAPADVRVMVLNGEGTGGLATRVAEVVAAAGFEVVGTDNNATYDVARTVIQVAAADEPRARLLAELFPDAEIVVVPRLGLTNVHVILLVGADRAGLDATSPSDADASRDDG